MKEIRQHWFSPRLRLTLGTNEARLDKIGTTFGVRRRKHAPVPGRLVCSGRLLGKDSVSYTGLSGNRDSMGMTLIPVSWYSSLSQFYLMAAIRKYLGWRTKFRGQMGHICPGPKNLLSDILFLGTIKKKKKIWF